eukprot:12831990-Alexandrium_andersonii.AAC.1
MGGTTLRAALPVPGSAARGSATFADSDARKGPFSPLGVLGPRPPRTRFGPEVNLPRHLSDRLGVPTGEPTGP